MHTDWAMFDVLFDEEYSINLFAYWKKVSYRSLNNYHHDEYEIGKLFW